MSLLVLTRRFVGLRPRLAFGLAIAVALCAPLDPLFAEPIELRLNRVQSYSPNFPAKREMNRIYRPELDEMRTELHKRLAAGENLACAAHILEETQWLLNYTDRRKDIDRRLKDLRKALDDGTVAPVQAPQDGSFGACFESWLWRFFRSVDPLKELAKTGKTPEVPLKIWDPVDTPEKITALMRSLLVSDETSAHDKRKELNLAITALGQLLWLDYTASVFPKHLDRKGLADALRKFVDDEWQDPKTGYWGAWYKVDGEIKKTNDLSITFHILSYRDGKVSRLAELADTTFALRREKYPFGWETGGTQNNHHAYDIARIINMTWDKIDATARGYAKSALLIMQARSLALSIDDDGVFDPSPYTTIGEAFYFGISFFDEVGLFGNPTSIETMTYVSDTGPLLKQIAKNLAKLDLSDPWVAAAKRKLIELSR